MEGSARSDKIELKQQHALTNPLIREEFALGLFTNKLKDEVDYEYYTPMSEPMDNIGKILTPESATHVSSAAENIHEDFVDDGIFEEFLENSTRVRLKTLSAKVLAANNALVIMTSNNQHLQTQVSQLKSSNCKFSKENIKYGKQIQNIETILVKKDNMIKTLQKQVEIEKATNSDLKHEINQSKCDFMKLNTKFKSYDALVNQGNKKMRDANQIINEKVAHFQQEIKDINAKFEEKCRNIQNLENRNKKLNAIVKKQYSLITLLKAQKVNIMQAKATKGLHDKYLSILSRINPQICDAHD